LSTLESALLAKADAALEQADLLLKAGHPDGAADRCYYAMFHAASALLASKGLQYTSHRAVLAAVGKELVQPGLLAPEASPGDSRRVRHAPDGGLRCSGRLGHRERRTSLRRGSRVRNSRPSRVGEARRGLASNKTGGMGGMPACAPAGKIAGRGRRGPARPRALSLGARTALY